ncbi:hypothetical protein GLOTRDRAFT_138030 [Gloeophyllum trabeum ATCC 11539]|uniref:RED-like N-terminal domain-containing protein n=1 Tax=Gloeophyllum trabeum (strain ATCC 11539 / FP-39264 / Madison 617) TaxID=670483 RepID=S7Q9P5_GLOTA|nr:uncharacterized protein GLOTRDRAFT_138030 [Gloeophyllum trabeum ATCC 11539]EPQ56242.1 hypothetical protein GLOTRDRAFT_138030 [Gloeophyllum trabeum ATCC 11539]
MDQESFRKLLESSRTPRPSSKGTPTASRGSIATTTTKSKAKTVDASEPAFKPRKVKKGGQGKYRDRAVERREGVGNDFAEVETLLEDFEKRNADAADLEEKRRYLGGDAEHSILVKGLDFALLEQNKARAAAEAAAQDDESLEKAFEEAATIPKKRTREDILRELKAKRQKGEIDEEAAKTEKAEKEKKERERDLALEEAKKKGKFKPIGFKPIGESAGAEGKKQKKKVKEKDEGERKKKKRKVQSADGKDTEPGLEAASGAAESAQIAEASTSKQEAPKPAPPPPPESEPLDDDFDIFAGAGEYEGLNIGDDDEDEEGEADAGPPPPESEPTQEPTPPAKANWFGSEESEPPALPTGPPPIIEKLKAKSRSPAPPAAGNEEEEEQPTKLAPLAGSAIPSIKEFLRMEEEAEKEKKRKARRDKKKGKKSKDDGDSE